MTIDAMHHVSKYNIAVLFSKVKSVIQSKLGETIKVEHRGASGLGMSGRDEIDVYVPIPQI